MMIIGCDLHTRYQQTAMLDTDAGAGAWVTWGRLMLIRIMPFRIMS
jgi:hypothetical protein